MKKLLFIGLLTLVSTVISTVSFAEVCFSLDETTITSGSFNVENCGPSGVNAILIPPNTSYKLVAVQGADCKIIAATMNLNGVDILMKYTLDIDTEQSCQLELTNGQQSATVEFSAVGS